MDVASLKEYDRVINITFSSENEAFEFFNDYAKRKGFSVRKIIIKRDKTNAAIKFCRFYCIRHGFREKKHIDKPNRKRQHKLLTRCGCPVKFCVKLDKQTETVKKEMKAMMPPIPEMLADDSGKLEKCRLVMDIEYKR